MTLKELRKRIADANDIPYEIEDCPHQGPCSGTCPKCEAEVRYLEKALEEKRERGEEVTIKGLMTEEELTLLVNNQDGIDIITEPTPLMGMPALHPEERQEEKLAREIFLAVKDCIRLAEKLIDGDITLQGEVEVPEEGQICDQETAWQDGSLEGDIVASNPPKPTKIKQILTSITVAGTSHIKDIEELSEDICQGVELTMNRDFINKYDPNAISLYLDDNRVGYVPKAKNEILANLLDADIPLIAVVTEAEWRGSWLEIKADIALTE